MAKREHALVDASHGWKRAKQKLGEKSRMTRREWGKGRAVFSNQWSGCQKLKNWKRKREEGRKKKGEGEHRTSNFQHPTSKAKN
jgi:hypothetical protein